MRSKLRALFSLFLIVVLAACSVQTTPASEPSPTSSMSIPADAELIVAAAADLQFAFTDITRRFEEQTGHKVTLVFGSTGQTAQQIENGAPYDLFAAANIDFVEQLAEKKLVLPDSVALYARGRIVLAVNRQSGITATTLTELTSPPIKHVALANPGHAPYGTAAMQALQSAGIWEQIQDKIVFAENIRQALQFVQTGDAEVGIVALSVADVPEVSWTLIDESLHQPLNQALAVVASSPHPELARAFATFISGEYGRPVMRKYGFILPGETPLLVQATAQP